MNNQLNKYLFKHFLNLDLWIEAKKLLDYQISSKYKYYNTINFYYFKKISNKTDKIGKRNYYEQRIANNAFYGLTNEFFFYKYTIPKSGIGLRSYLFFSYPMQLLYYSIGLYLLKLSSQFILDNKKNYNLSRYGGDLRYDTNNGQLVINDDTTLYSKHYSAFKQDIRQQTINRDNKIVLRLDIQNYFDCISMSNLLTLLEDSVKTSDKTILNYDKDTIRLLEFYFQFLNNNSLPQANNNLISGFIGFLYLFFGDLEIERLLSKINAEYGGILKDYKIIRYVDDIYLFLEFKGLEKLKFGINTDSDNYLLKMIAAGYSANEVLEDFQLLEKIKHFINDFLFALSDIFYKKLSLRFNSKSEILWLDSDKDLNKLFGIINKVSEDYTEIEDDDNAKPQIKITKLAEALRTIRSKSLVEVFTSEHKNLQNILRYSFDKSVNHILDTQPKELEKIEKELEVFDFNYVHFYTQTITLLICKIPKIKQKYRDFILSKKNLTTFDVDLVINYLCQTDFSDKQLIKTLENSPIKPIIQYFNKKTKVLDNKNTGFYDIDFTKIVRLFNEISLIEQVRQRNYAEINSNYSIALNHLLNELQLICFLLEKPNNVEIKKYDSNKVISFLTRKGVDSLLSNDISNLFDRRNNNPISHPGNDIRFAKLVDKNEYDNYKTKVNNTIGILLNN